MSKKSTLPPLSRRGFWDVPTPGNEFAQAYAAGKVDVDALAKQLHDTARRAAARGHRWAIDELQSNAEFIADQVARRNPGFDIDMFCSLLGVRVNELLRAGRE